MIKDEIIEEELYPILARSIAFFAKLERAQRGRKQGASNKTIGRWPFDMNID